MDNARITAYRPPVLAPELPTRQPRPPEDGPDMAPEPTKPVRTVETKTPPLNPLAAFFGRGLESTAVKQIINQPVDNQQVRGRFVDVVA